MDVITVKVPKSWDEEIRRMLQQRLFLPKK